MSRRSNDVLRLALAADRVEATLRGGWLGRTPLAHAQRTIAPGAAAGVDPADALVEAMDGVLQDIAAQAPLRGARLDMELPSALLHLDVVEGDFADRTARQLQDIAGACLAEILGDDAGAQAMRWHLQRNARHLVIVAIARTRLARFEELAGAAGLRLRSVQPAFVLRWNEFGRAMRSGRGVFAVNTSSDLSIAAVVDGAIACISTGPGIAVHGVAEAATDMRRARILDARVDGLLASRGLDPQDQSGFFLVTSEPAPAVASTRWSVIESTKAAA